MNQYSMNNYVNTRFVKKFIICYILKHDFAVFKVSWHKEYPLKAHLKIQGTEIHWESTTTGLDVFLHLLMYK